MTNPEDKKTDDADAAIAAITEALRPQVDEALRQFGRMMIAQLTEVSQTEIDRCISVVDACRIAGTSERAVTWNDALKFAADHLRDWKKEAAKP
jgi:hypothetical protein